MRLKITDAPVAQLDRASDYGSEGCEFESRRARQLSPCFYKDFLFLKSFVKRQKLPGHTLVTRFF